MLLLSFSTRCFTSSVGACQSAPGRCLTATCLPADVSLLVTIAAVYRSAALLKVKGVLERAAAMTNSSPSEIRGSVSAPSLDPSSFPTAPLSDAFADVATRSLSLYVQLSHQSLAELQARRFTTARLLCAESLPALLSLLFALTARPRPSYAGMVAVCAETPLLPSLDTSHPLHASNLLSSCTAMLDHNVSIQRRLTDVVLAIASSQPSLTAALASLPDDVRHPVSSISTHRGGPSDASTQKLLSFINRTHSTAYTLLQRLDGGHSTGAHLLRAPDSSLAVLKWTADKQQASHVNNTARLLSEVRSRGYPTPAWLLWGVSPSGYPYHVEGWVDAQPVSRQTGWTAAMVRRMLAVFDSQRTVQTATDVNALRRAYLSVRRELSLPWSEPAEEGKQGSQQRREGAVWDELRRFVAPCEGMPLTDGRDFVHGDLNLGNVLIDGAQQLHIVDCEMVGRGSVLQDAMTLLLSLARQPDRDEAAVASVLDYVSGVAGAGQQREARLALCMRLLLLLLYSTDEQRRTEWQRCEPLLRTVEARLTQPVGHDSGASYGGT